MATIGLDFDDTLIKGSIIDSAVKELGYSYYSNQTPRDWHLSEFPKPLRDRIFEMYVSKKHMCEDITIIPGVKPFLQKLKRNDHKLVIITARSSKIKIPTIKFIKDNFPEIDEHYFVEPHETKKDLFKSLKLDFWVDDAPHEVKNALNLGISTFMIQNHTTSYNFHISERPNLKIIKSVKELILKDFMMAENYRNK